MHVQFLTLVFYLFISTTSSQTLNSISSSGTNHSYDVSTTLSYDPIHNSIILFGGASGYSFTSNMTKLNPTNWTYNSIISSGSPPSPRVSATCAVPSNGFLYCFGGYPYDSSTKMFKYDLEADMWIQYSEGNIGAAAFPMERHTMVVGDGGTKLYIFGGVYHITYDTTVRIFDTVTDSWIGAAIPNAFAPDDRFDHCAAMSPDGTKMLIYGGWNASRIPKGGIFMFDIVTNQWIDISPIDSVNVPPHRARSVCGSPVNGKFVLAGGQTSESGINLGGFWIYDLTLRSWSSVQLIFPTSNSYFSFTPMGTTLILRNRDYLLTLTTVDLFSLTSGIVTTSPTTSLITTSLVTSSIVTSSVLTSGSVTTSYIKSEVSNESSNSDRTFTVAIAISTSVVVIVIVIGVILVLRYFMIKSRVVELEDLNNDIVKANDSSKFRDVFIEYSELVFEEEIERGSFGVVFKGKWNETPVALKVLNIKSLQGSEGGKDQFLKEALFMAKMRLHSNVVLFLGITHAPHPIVIVTEYCAGGSLKTLLNSNRSLDEKEQIKIMLGVARGLLHLHSNKIIHRDIAARNVLLTENLEAKVSDFGLSRQVLSSEMEDKSSFGPVRWMAPESLMKSIFSEKTDSWSYGVTLWEVVSRKEPYTGFLNREVAEKVISGYRMQIPVCKNVFQKIMTLCWQEDSNSRPSMKEICQILQSEFELNERIASLGFSQGKGASHAYENL